jgi:hypothetical protein
VVTVALDIDIELARPWHDAAQATHPSLIDTTHATNALFGFTNIPMAVWIDENGTLVRPAEAASIERSPLRDMEIPEGLPEQLSKVMHAVKAIPDDAEAYRAAILDWVRNGAASKYAMTPDEVIERSRPHSDDRARATACFELGEHLRRHGHADAAVAWWKEGHGPSSPPPRVPPSTTSCKVRTTCTRATWWTRFPVRVDSRNSSFARHCEHSTSV